LENPLTVFWVGRFSFFLRPGDYFLVGIEKNYIQKKFPLFLNDASLHILFLWHSRNFYSFLAFMSKSVLSMKVIMPKPMTTPTTTAQQKGAGIDLLSLAIGFVIGVIITLGLIWFLAR
jgi:hypothetical protein